MTRKRKILRVGIVAAEPSGDVLAAGLMAALQSRYPGVRFEGIGGPGMAAEGLQSWVPMEKLSVMGLVEVLRHLPSLLRIRRKLLNRWRKDPPDLFIGVDAPDFNLGLEIGMRKMGVPTVQYVCPTIWAWRKRRVYKIARAADLVLSIFPFEAAMLKEYDIRVRYVGHPLAAEFPKEVDRASARRKLALPVRGRVLALLPGSRMNEIKALSEPFLQTAAACVSQLPGLRILTPMVNEQTRRQFEKQLAAIAPDLPIQVIEGDSQSVLSAADVALVASGTATFEALLCECPMVVGYKTNKISYNIVMALRLIRTRYFAMANILAGEGLAPELIQHDCIPEKLIPAVLKWFIDPEAADRVRARYKAIHAGMNLDTNELAAYAVLSWLKEKKKAEGKSAQAKTPASKDA